MRFILLVRQEAAGKEWPVSAWECLLIINRDANHALLSSAWGCCIQLYQMYRGMQKACPIIFTWGVGKLHLAVSNVSGDVKSLPSMFAQGLGMLHLVQPSQVQGIPAWRAQRMPVLSRVLCRGEPQHVTQLSAAFSTPGQTCWGELSTRLSVSILP